MKKRLLWILVCTFALFVLLQLWPSPRTNPPTRFSGPIVSAKLDSKLRAACYDCHSNQTRWPWYARVQPIKYLVVWDVEEGRRDLNFDEWGTMQPQQRAKALNESAEEIAEDKMPPKSYVLLHPEAGLDQQTKQELIEALKRIAEAQR